MEAWFASDADIIPLKTWDQASAIILVEGYKIFFPENFYTCPFSVILYLSLDFIMKSRFSTRSLVR